MRYAVETTKDGVNVYLRTKHGEFSMRYKRAAGGISSTDKDFCKQIEDAGELNEAYLDELDEVLSDIGIFPLGLLGFADEWEVEE